MLLCRIQTGGPMVTGGVGCVRYRADAFCGAHRDIGRCLWKIFHSLINSKSYLYKFQVIQAKYRFLTKVTEQVPDLCIKRR
jgi:hypothetical protein